MASNEFKYTIRAEDKSRSAVQSATRGMSTMESSAKKLGNMLKGAFTVTAILAVGRAVTRVAGDLLDAYAKQEQAERKLAQAVSNNPFMDQRNINSLQDYASHLQSITTIGDETTLELMSMAAAWGRNEEEIKQLVTAAADLSAGLGMDLTTAARGLNNVMEGNVTTLSRYIPSLRNLTEEQIQSGEAMRIINEQFGGMAEAMRNTTGGALEAFNNSWGDLKENLGGLFNDVLLPVIEALTTIINKLNEAFARRDARTALKDALDGYADVQSIQLAIAAQERQILNAQEAAQRARDNYTISQTNYDRISSPTNRGYLEMARTQRNEALNALAEQENIMVWLMDYQQRLNDMLPEQIQAPDLSLGNSDGGGGSTTTNPVWNGLVDLSGVIQRAGFTIGQDLIPAVEDASFTIGEDLVTSHVLFQGSLSDTADAMDNAAKTVNNFSNAVREGERYARVPFRVGSQEMDWQIGDALSGGLAKFGDALLKLGDSAMSTVMSIGSVAAALDPLGTLFNMMVQALTPLIDNALAPLMTAFQNIALILAGNLVPYFQVLTPILAVFSSLLEAVASLFVVFLPIINLLVQAFKVLATPIVTIATVINWAAQWIRYAIGVLTFWTNKDNVSKPGSLGSMIAAAVGDLWSDQELPGLATPEVPTTTTGAGAQYTTGRNITVNVDINTGYYFGNEREFAIAIRDEIRAAEALGA